MMPKLPKNSKNVPKTENSSFLMFTKYMLQKYFRPEFYSFARNFNNLKGQIQVRLEKPKWPKLGENLDFAILIDFDHLNVILGLRY